MTNSKWPFPGDSPAARARRVAQAYRAMLDHHAPRACADLDRRMRNMGQHWVVPGVVTQYDPEQWLSPAEAAELACVEVDAIRQMRRRGIIAGRRNGRQWEYQVREIESAFTRVRGRKATVTDTITNSGTGVST